MKMKYVLTGAAALCILTATGCAAGNTANNAAGLRNRDRVTTNVHRTVATARPTQSPAAAPIGYRDYDNLGSDRLYTGDSYTMDNDRVTHNTRNTYHNDNTSNTYQYRNDAATRGIDASRNAVVRDETQAVRRNEGRMSAPYAANDALYIDTTHNATGNTVNRGLTTSMGNRNVTDSTTNRSVVNDTVYNNTVVGNDLRTNTMTNAAGYAVNTADTTRGRVTNETLRGNAAVNNAIDNASNYARRTTTPRVNPTASPAVSPTAAPRVTPTATPAAAPSVSPTPATGTTLAAPAPYTTGVTAPLPNATVANPAATPLGNTGGTVVY